ncbi:MAG: hypothetical protein QM504_00855 [Pseudomonadota bacterium]
MFDSSSYTLKLLAAAIWYSGVVILLIKSTSLFIEAERINPEQLWTPIAFFSGLILGSIKAKYIFQKLCFKNLDRIDTLKQPKIWNFYRLHFFIFLFSMVTLGAYLSRVAEGDYPVLITVAIIDISIATALLGSSHCFWKKRNSTHL